jgi:hypothetical protein
MATVQSVAAHDPRCNFYTVLNLIQNFTLKWITLAWPASFALFKFKKEIGLLSDKDVQLHKIKCFPAKIQYGFQLIGCNIPDNLIYISAKVSFQYIVSY